jgi:hypothetical protein
MDRPKELRVQFDGAGASALRAALAYAGVRTVARLLTALAPMSALTALLTTLLWLAAALYVVGMVTWQREDNWLGAGIIIGLTLLCGGLVAELIGRIVQTGTLEDAILAVAGSMVTLLVRTLLLIPLSGGFVAGVRWLTHELRRSDVWT